MKDMIQEIAAKVAQSLITNLIKTSWKKLTSSDYTPYERELQKVILNSITEYQKSYPIQETDKIPFYTSKVLFEELLKFRFTAVIDNDSLLQAIKNDTRIIIPTKEQLTLFFDIFNKEFSEASLLKELTIEHHYKEEIFRISKKMDEAKDIFSSTLVDFKREIIALNMNAALVEEWSKQLDETYENIKSFKPLTAQERLNTLEARMTQAGLDSDRKLFSRLYYLQALCLVQMEGKNLGTKEAELIVKAYTANPGNLAYKANAALAFYILGDKTISANMAEEILTLDPFNTIGWALRCYMKENDLSETLAKVPLLVKKSKDFTLHLYHWLKNKNLIPTTQHFKELGLDFEFNVTGEPEPITHSNRHFHLVKASYLLTEYYEKDNRFNSVLHMPSAKKDPGFVYAHKILGNLLTTLKGTEVEDFHRYYFFQFYCTRLILDEDLKHVPEMEREFNLLPQKHYDSVVRMAQACNNMGQDNWTIKGAQILEQYSEKLDEIILLFLFINYMMVGNDEKSEEYFCRYADYEKRFNKFVFLNTTAALRQGKLKGSEKIKAKLVELTTKDSEDERLGRLLKVVLYIIYEIGFTSRDEFYHELKDLEKNTDDLEISILLQIPYGFLLIEKYDDGIQFLKTNSVFDQPSEAYQLYCKLLYKSDQNKPELFEHLKKWRIEFKAPDYELLSMEAYFARLQQDWKELSKICKFALDAFPGSQKFLFLLFTAWSENQDIESIRNNVEMVKGIEFNDENRGIAVATCLIKAGLHQDAMNIMFTQASKKGNKLSRQSYISLSIHFPRELLHDFPIAEIGCFVKYQIDQKRYLIEITEDNKTEFPQSLLLGKATGDSISFSNQLGGALQFGQILRVCDKYLALLEDILLEAENPMSGLGIGVMQLGDGTPEEMTKALIEQFGAQGTVIQESSEETFEKYYNGNISFSEITGQIFKGDYFNAYYILTDPNGKLFKAISPANSTGVRIDDNTKFVLDASSCCLLYDLSKKLNVTYQKKFIISNLLKTELARKIAEDKINPATELSVTITQDRVRPHFYPAEAAKKRIQHFESLMEWINQNCETTPVPERFNFIMNLSEEHKADAFFQMVLENKLLADRDNSLLLTNDVLYYRSFHCPTNLAISPLIYLHHFHIDKEREIIDFHLEHNYVGLLLTADILYDELLKYLGGKENRYWVCLENLRFNWNPYSPHIGEAIKFIKALYLASFLNNITREQIITAVFSNLLVGLPIRNARLLPQIIMREFKLLPIQLADTLGILTNLVEGRGL